MLKQGESGGVALEYVIVSVFGLLMSIFAISYVGKVGKKYLEKSASKTDVPIDEFNFDF